MHNGNESRVRVTLWIVGLLCLCIFGSFTGSLGRWVFASLGWVVGSLGLCIVGSLGRWVVGSLGCCSTDSFLFQENKKNFFMFKYSGPVFDQYVKRELDIRQYEGFVDESDSYVNVAIYTLDRHRPSELKNMITRYNSDVHHTRLQIQIRQQSEFDDNIMTLSGCRNPKNHPFYLRILEHKHTSSYFIWSLAQEHITDETQPKNLKLKRQLELDLMTSVYTPSGPRRKKQIGKERMSFADQPMSHDIQAFDSTTNADSLALEDLANLYHSDDELSQELSPKSLRLERMERQLDTLLIESEARDLLAAKVMEQSVEIEDHKLKRDQQEAKTAAQTRAANLALESKIKAEKEALEARQIATEERSLREEERRLREIAEKEKSALMSSNIHMSSSLATLSAQDSVS
jgi:hypothetical protein